MASTDLISANSHAASDAVADPAHSPASLDAGLAKLKKAGFRLTPQRRAILALFRAGERGHLTPQQIFSDLQAATPSLSLATVYNTLEVLEEVGLISRINAHDGQTYFDRTVAPHHHAICDSCDAIFDVFLAPQALEALLAATRISQPDRGAFQVDHASIWLRGTCRSCRE